MNFHWSLVQLTPEEAEAHDRRCYNVQPNVGLGWKPYTFRATYGAISQFACHTEEQLAHALSSRGLKITGWSEWRNGIRTTQLERS